MKIFWTKKSYDRHVATQIALWAKDNHFSDRLFNQTDMWNLRSYLLDTHGGFDKWKFGAHIYMLTLDKLNNKTKNDVV